MSANYRDINYEQESEKILNFVQNFKAAVEDAPRHRTAAREAEPSPKYIQLLQNIADRSLKAIVVDLDDLHKYDPADDLVEHIEMNAKRYVELFSKVIDSLMPEDVNEVTEESDPLDVVMFHIQQMEDARREQLPAGAVAPQRRFPVALSRRYNLYFKPRTDKKRAFAVREVKGEHVGRLLTLRGIVTRISDVKPMMVVNTMSCDQCGAEIFQEVNARAFTPLIECPSDECKRNQTKGKLYMQTRASKFIKYQEMKIQELSDQVPMGHIPRAMTIHLYEDQCRNANPGDLVNVAGVLLPQPYTGYRALRAGLITDIFLDAHEIVQLKKQYADMQLTPAIAAEITALSRDRDVYSILSRSVAPEIWGHEDVKKALLLQLVGGAEKATADGMKIRGDLNVCLMGDPGVAKSQLLKYISRVAPRGVYTTGRGSSGVGLTASVMRDPVTSEMVLEGGALVLADNGVCCIDEFDKMDDSDRTAIHEVMEQQTISISKAGITTTLNARTSILAAANPQYGRYNKKKKPTENINLPAALLSRFDLLFLILDTPNMDDDLRLAQHVTFVHMHNRHPGNENGGPEIVSMDVMRHYIARARTFHPTVPPAVANHIVNAYVHLRNRVDELAEFQYTCARTLLSVVRMGTSLARLRFSDSVEIGDVDEALRLMEISKSSLRDEDVVGRTDPITRIYDLINELGRAREYRRVKVSDILSRVKSKGYSEADLQRTLEQYEHLELLSRSANGDYVEFVFAQGAGPVDSDEDL